MQGTQLRQLMDLFEKAEGPLTIPDLAVHLGATRGRVEGLVDFWVRKGRIQVSSSLSDCGHCSVKGDCQLVLESLRVYELVGSESEDLVIHNSPCLR